MRFSGSDSYALLFLFRPFAACCGLRGQLNTALKAEQRKSENSRRVRECSLLAIVSALWLEESVEYGGITRIKRLGSKPSRVEPLPGVRRIPHTVNCNM